MASAAPWRQLLIDSLEANKHLMHSKHFQLVLDNVCTFRDFLLYILAVVVIAVVCVLFGMSQLHVGSDLHHDDGDLQATVKQNGAPAVRTIVFRGFEDGSNKLLITTDARSRKVEEIKNSPLGECVVYFSDSWEQFRISGFLDLIGPESPPEAQKTRQKLWDASSPRSLLQLVGPYPGTPLSKEELPQPHLDKDGGPVENFFIVTLDPTEVDYLHLQEGRRVYFEKKENLVWTEQELNP